MRYWPFVRGIHRSPVHSPHKDHWREALMFSLNCARTNGWANNRDAANLRRHRADYDVTLMIMRRNYSASHFSGATRICKCNWFTVLVTFSCPRSLIAISLKFLPHGPIVLFHNHFSPSGEQPEQRTAGCIAMFRKYCRNTKYNKIDSMKYLGVYYRYVKMPRCGYLEHGLKYNVLCSKPYSPVSACSGHALVGDRPLEAPAFVKLAYWFR